MNNQLVLDKDIFNILSQYGSVRLDEEMKNHTSFKTGGTVSCLVYPESDQGAAAIIAYLHEGHIPYTVLGGCTNLVVGDRGIDGVVIKMSHDEGTPATKPLLSDDNIIYCPAGVKKSDFIRFALQNKKGGIEFMVGIPGCIGGGIIMNAGTYMGTFSDILDRVRYISIQGEIKEISLDHSNAEYRDIGLGADCALVLGGYFVLPDCDDTQSLQKRIDEINDDRKVKHPVEFPSAGSVFKNPPGHASWKLVNDSGLKGYAIGGAQVSEKHTNFIINAGGATSAEIRALVEYVRNRVYETYSVELNTEIRMIGNFD